MLADQLRQTNKTERRRHKTAQNDLVIGSHHKTFARLFNITISQIGQRDTKQHHSQLITGINWQHIDTEQYNYRPVP